MITISNLTRRYGDNVAVQGVSTRIERGEIVGLLGHNGAGKTTVMKILTGFLEASEGTVTVDGLDVHDDRAEVQRRIGYLPENAPLYDEMLVQEYLRTVAELRGVAPAEIDARVAEAVVSTGLGDRLLAPIGTLSKGLRQRVGIAQALLHHPDVLILDEPTNGLDPMQIESIRQLVRQLGKKTTILLSTHILQEVEAVCDRVIVLIGGRLAADERLDVLLRARRVVLELAEGAEGVEGRLGALPGVTHVAREGGASGRARYAVEWTGEAPPVPAIVTTAAAAGWTVHAVAPEGRTLETVFKELQARHATGGAA